MSRYLVAEYWVHCFVGSQESYTDWVLDVERRELVCGFLHCGGRYEALRADELACLQEDVEQNVLDRIDEGTFDAEDEDLDFMDELPSWAKKIPDPRQLELALRIIPKTASPHRTEIR